MGTGQGSRRRVAVNRAFLLGGHYLVTFKTFRRGVTLFHFPPPCPCVVEIQKGGHVSFSPGPRNNSFRRITDEEDNLSISLLTRASLRLVGPVSAVVPAVADAVQPDAGGAAAALELGQAAVGGGADLQQQQQQQREQQLSQLPQLAP